MQQIEGTQRPLGYLRIWCINRNFRGRALCLCGPMKTLLCNTERTGEFTNCETHPLLGVARLFLKTKEREKSFCDHSTLLNINKAFDQLEEGEEKEWGGRRGKSWGWMYRFYSCKVTKSCGMLHFADPRPTPQERAPAPPRPAVFISGVKSRGHYFYYKFYLFSQKAKEAKENLLKDLLLSFYYG